MSECRVTDIRLPLGGLNFSVRVVILCVRGGQLLTQTAEGFHFLPGGALATGEDTFTCARREWEEETGLTAGELRLVGVVENFFGPIDRRQHEIGFYVRMDPPPGLPDGPFALLDNDETRFEWLALEACAAHPVYPLAALDLLEVPAGEVRHIVNREDRHD